MPTLVVALAAIFGVLGLYAGARTLRRWDDSNDPDYFRDVVQQGVLALLKLGLLVLLLVTAIIAFVGGLAADRGDSPIPRGVWVSLVLTIALAAGFIVTYAKHRRRR